VKNSYCYRGPSTETNTSLHLQLPPCFICYLYRYSNVLPLHSSDTCNRLHATGSRTRLLSPAAIVLPLNNHFGCTGAGTTSRLGLGFGCHSEVDLHQSALAAGSACRRPAHSAAMSHIQRPLDGVKVWHQSKAVVRPLGQGRCGMWCHCSSTCRRAAGGCRTCCGCSEGWRGVPGGWRAAQRGCGGGRSISSAALRSP
jgi:hypothetical protein